MSTPNPDLRWTQDSERIEADVVVVGLGPVGAALSVLLGRYGLRVLAIDKATEIFTKPRAIALDNEALRILQMVGVHDGEFATVAIPQVQYHSPLFGRFARIGTAGIIDGHPMLVTFYQPELEALLRRKLTEHPSVQTRLGAELQMLHDDGEQVHLRGRDADGRHWQARARFVVGCDGASSLVRRLLGLEFEGQTFAQDWLIVDAQEVPQPIDHIEFICDPRRPTPHMVAPAAASAGSSCCTRAKTPRPSNAPRPCGACWPPGATRTASTSSAPPFTASMPARSAPSPRGAASWRATPRM
jgi:3-(3-hydroxy-phenyl)propionate hydroxylase